jgi:hypothetical protein
MNQDSNKNKKVLLSGVEDLMKVLRRMTTRRFLELRQELGDIDLSDSPELFYFTDRDICQEIGGDFANVQNTMVSSGLWYFVKGTTMFTYLPDLESRL